MQEQTGQHLLWLSYGPLRAPAAAAWHPMPDGHCLVKGLHSYRLALCEGMCSKQKGCRLDRGESRLASGSRQFKAGARHLSVGGVQW